MLTQHSLLLSTIRWLLFRMASGMLLLLSQWQTRTLSPLRNERSRRVTSSRHRYSKDMWNPSVKSSTLESLEPKPWADAAGFPSCKHLYFWNWDLGCFTAIPPQEPYFQQMHHWRFLNSSLKKR